MGWGDAEPDAGELLKLASSWLKLGSLLGSCSMSSRSVGTLAVVLFATKPWARKASGPM